MKPDENMEKFVRGTKPHVATGRPMDQRTLEDSYAAMEEALRAKSTARKPSVPGVILRSRAVRLAAAAAIIVAVTLFVFHKGPSEQDRPQTADVAKSPAEMLTVMSLNIAYHRGGIEAVDDQADRAFKMLGAQPAGVSIRELLAESNGV